MRKTILGLALALPLAAVAGPPGRPGGGPGPGPDEAGPRREHMMKRMRMVRTVALAEALDLSEAEAIHLRDVMAKFDERGLALARQTREAAENVRKAARGDAAAQKGLDESLKKLRELRGQAQALRDEMFQAVTKDFSPERKAKAYLFLQKFRHRMASHMMQLRERSREMRGPMREERGGPRGGMPRWGMMGPPDGDDAPDLEILPEE